MGANTENNIQIIVFFGGEGAGAIVPLSVRKIVSLSGYWYSTPLIWGAEIPVLGFDTGWDQILKNNIRIFGFLWWGRGRSCPCRFGRSFLCPGTGHNRITGYWDSTRSILGAEIPVLGFYKWWEHILKTIFEYSGFFFWGGGLGAIVPLLVREIVSLSLHQT